MLKQIEELKFLEKKFSGTKRCKPLVSRAYNDSLLKICHFIHENVEWKANKINHALFSFKFKVKKVLEVI